MKKLKLTDAEFAALVDLVYAGNWLVNDWRLPRDAIIPYKEMFDRIIGLVIKDKTKAVQIKSAEAVLTAVNEEIYDRMQEYYKTYTDKTVLMQFAEMLADQNYENRRTLEWSEAAEAYWEEFEKNGLKNVSVG